MLSATIRIAAVLAFSATWLGCLTGAFIELAREEPLDHRYFALTGDEAELIWIWWSRYEPSEGEAPTRWFTGHELTLLPPLPLCPRFPVFVNPTEESRERLPLSSRADVKEGLSVNGIHVSEPIVPEDSFPECSVVLTFGQIASHPTSAIVAATKTGVFAEIPHEKAQPAWLLVTPATAVIDVFVGGFFAIGALGSAFPF